MFLYDNQREQQKPRIFSHVLYSILDVALMTMMAVMIHGACEGVTHYRSGGPVIRDWQARLVSRWNSSWKQ